MADIPQATADFLTQIGHGTGVQAPEEKGQQVQSELAAKQANIDQYAAAAQPQQAAPGPQGSSPQDLVNANYKPQAGQKMQHLHDLLMSDPQAAKTQLGDKFQDAKRFTKALDSPNNKAVELHDDKAVLRMPGDITVHVPHEALGDMLKNETLSGSLMGLMRGTQSKAEQSKSVQYIMQALHGHSARNIAPKKP